jgi:zinc transport system permease protein
LSKGGGFNKYSSYLIGDLLSITIAEICFLFIVFILVIILWIFLFNKLLLDSINKSLAASRGINVFAVELAFTIAIAVVVTVSIRWVGLLIINSLLILPAAAARNISPNMRRYHINSVAISIVSGISGLILSYYWGTATGATITLVCAAIYFLTFALRRKFI